MNVKNLEKVQKKVLTIQKQWATSIIGIGKAFIDKKDYLDLTNKFLDKLYFFDNEKVLFKPTKASNKQFRRLQKDWRN